MALRYMLPPTIAIGAGLAIHSHQRHLLLRPHYCEGPGVFSGLQFPWLRRAPPPPRDYSGYEPVLYREIATGSFVGVAVGLMVAKFGRPLALFVASILVILESMATKGINIIPSGVIRRLVGDIDMREVLLRHPAFKVSFGTTFVIAAFYA